MRAINFRDKSCNFSRDWLRIISSGARPVLCCIAVLSANWFRRHHHIASIFILITPAPVHSRNICKKMSFRASIYFQRDQKTNNKVLDFYSYSNRLYAMVRRRYRAATWNESSNPDSVALVQSSISPIQRPSHSTFPLILWPWILTKNLLLVALQMKQIELWSLKGWRAK